MNQRVSERLRKMVFNAMRHNQGVHGRKLYQQVKKDYLATPRTEREKFTIFV